MHTGGDFWHFGGLMRSVELHALPAAADAPWPWRAYVLPLVPPAAARALAALRDGLQRSAKPSLAPIEASAARATAVLRKGGKGA